MSSANGNGRTLQGHLTVPIDLPEGCAVAAVGLVHWFIEGNQMKASLISLTITGPITPDVLPHLPTTQQTLSQFLQNVAQGIAEQLREQATGLKPATMDDLRRITQGS